MTGGAGTPSDWVSGERVFAPPRGTVDVDWLVPAVLELAPGTSPAQARAALEQAWLRRRGGVGDQRVAAAELTIAAEAVLAEALATFGD